jgi:hypothetical protein
MTNIPTNDLPALENRKIYSRYFTRKKQVRPIKIAKGAYYPAIAIIGGYTALDLSNVTTVQNAMNIGVGISYDLSAILMEHVSKTSRK